MKNLVLLFSSLFSSSLFAQTEAIGGQANEKLIIWGLGSVFLILMVCYIIALRKSRKGEMVVFVNIYDFILMFSSYVFLLIAIFFAKDIDIIYFWILIALFFACFITSMVWAVLANKNIKLGILAVLAKLFLMVIFLFIIILYIGYTVRKTTKIENGQKRKLTSYEQMLEDEDREKRKVLAFKIISFLFLSLIIGTTAYKSVMQKNSTDEQKINNSIQNVDIKKLLYTFLGVTIVFFLIGYYGISYRSEKNNPTEIQADSSIDEEDWSLESKSTSEFDEFFKKFNSDKSYQLSRIIFPMTITLDEMGEISQKTITKNEWEFDQIDEKSDYYYVVKKIKENKATIWLSGKENGVNIEYFFEKRNNQWCLVSMKDAST